MVTSPFKDGQRVTFLGISGEGSRLLGNSWGVFANTAGASENGTYYEYARTAAGWTTTPIDPPGSVFPYSEFTAASTSVERTLWRARTAAESVYALNLVIREPDGSLQEVGPMIPPSFTGGPPGGSWPRVSYYWSSVNFAGASADLSHVLFSVAATPGFYATPFWPGDTTDREDGGVHSLYEYVGTGNTHPALVGANEEGHLISDCGIELGAGGEELYNAVSDNGEKVFFVARSRAACSSLPAGGMAPEVNELWARIGGGELVPISEPSSNQCEACNTAAAKAPARFVGASQDGSKAFFLTEQELFAGQAGTNLYEYDFDNPNGRKIVLASGGSGNPEVLGVARVSEDGSHVYFVARGVLTSEPRGGSCQDELSESMCRPQPGAYNLYVFERDATYPQGHVAFIATLTGSDGEDWQTTDERPVQATADGRFMVFQSAADLTPGDTSSEPQLFEYDALQEELVRVSTSQAGYANGLANANAHPAVMLRQSFTATGTGGLQPQAATTDLVVSAAGTGSQALAQVVFDSAAALTPGAEAAAAAGASSVYEYRSAGAIRDGNVFLISDGTDAQSAEAGGLDASGTDVFFATADPLLAQDTDGQYDIYDARSDGGFPAPAVPTVCEGEGCQGAVSPGPSLGVAGSASAVAGGNLTPAAQSPGPVVVTKPKSKPKHKKHVAKRGRRRVSKRRTGGRLVRGKRSVVQSKVRG
jgi:hypothetical protein